MPDSHESIKPPRKSGTDGRRETPLEYLGKANTKTQKHGEALEESDSDFRGDIEDWKHNFQLGVKATREVFDG